jgi:hypothetical protein
MVDIDSLLALAREVARRESIRLSPGTDDSAIFEFTDRTGVTVPDDLAAWLKRTNGNPLGPGGLFGIATHRKALDVELRYCTFPKWRDCGWIPVAGDGCGNYYMLATQHEFGFGYPVFFVDVIADSETPAYIVASAIGPFLRFILEQELREDRLWPFNRGFVLDRDPEIEEFGIPLPWDS